MLKHATIMIAGLVVFALTFLSALSGDAQGKPPSRDDIASANTTATPLPPVFTKVLPQIKAQSQVPVLLPEQLPRAIEDAKHAIVRATADQYAISLYFELDSGDAGFAAFFSADKKPMFRLQELPNVQEVKLVHGVQGFFRPISCGGSCAPANIWWEDRGVEYQIQIKTFSSKSEQNQARTLIDLANSSILAGPR